MEKVKPKVPIKQLVNWYSANYCARKCYNDETRQDEHLPKLQALAQKLSGLKMTHQEFLDLLRSDKTICDLSDEEWKNRKFSWKNTDCIVCRKFGIR